MKRFFLISKLSVTQFYKKIPIRPHVLISWYSNAKCTSVLKFTRCKCLNILGRIAFYRSGRYLRLEGNAYKDLKIRLR